MASRDLCVSKPQVLEADAHSNTLAIHIDYHNNIMKSQYSTSFRLASESSTILSMDILRTTPCLLLQYYVWMICLEHFG